MLEGSNTPYLQPSKDKTLIGAPFPTFAHTPFNRTANCIILERAVNEDVNGATAISRIIIEAPLVNHTTL